MYDIDRSLDDRWRTAPIDAHAARHPSRIRASARRVGRPGVSTDRRPSSAAIHRAWLAMPNRRPCAAPATDEDPMTTTEPPSDRRGDRRRRPGATTRRRPAAVLGRDTEPSRRPPPAAAASDTGSAFGAMRLRRGRPGRRCPTRPSSRASAVATRPPSPSSPRARPSSTSGRAAASTSCCRPGGSARPASPTAST